MGIGTPELVLVAGLALLLVTTCVTDWRHRDIPNWLTGAVAGCAPLYWWASGAALWPDIAIYVAIAAATFAVAVALFALNLMGGGDVKLVAALALWIPGLDFMRMLIAMSVIGGVMTVGTVAGLWTLPRSAGRQVSMRLTVLTLLFVGTLIALPLIGGGDPRALAGLIVWAPELEAAKPAIGIAALVACLGFGIAVGRKSGQVEVPYGLAIAFAGLGVLSQRYLNHFA